jgi:hypothetical protein
MNLLATHPDPVPTNIDDAVVSDLGDTWAGQFPVTSFVVTALRRRRAAAGVAALDVNERVLLSACEFWAATRQGKLIRYLADDPSLLLQSAVFAFSRVHATRVANAIRATQEFLDCHYQRATVIGSVQSLSQQLEQIDEDVEGLISRFASTLVHDANSED